MNLSYHQTWSIKYSLKWKPFKKRNFSKQVEKIDREREREHYYSTRWNVPMEVDGEALYTIKTKLLIR